jgi:hypothetical protein
MWAARHTMVLGVDQRHQTVEGSRSPLPQAFRSMLIF